MAAATTATPKTNAAKSQFATLSDFTKATGPIRHCKIVGTLGPASSDEATLRALIRAGLDVARLNFSHGEHETHRRNVDLVRRIAREEGRNVAILQDLQGPKIRCGKLIGDKITLRNGEQYGLAFAVEQTDSKIIPIDYRDLVKDVAVGQRVMMDDGLLVLRIESIVGDIVNVVVVEGGVLKPRKGVNFPDAKLSLPAMTEKDSRDLLFGISVGVDYVALSFVQDPADIHQIKKMIKALGADVPVIAKIEKIPAIHAIDAIAEISDGLMVARGDLGVEGNVERVPGFQRRIVEAARNHAKPVIIATQMLESMIENPRATLAEMADVANGVLDGADCLMLSGEVASGKYPVECVETMVSIIQEVEQWTARKTATITEPARPEGSAGPAWEEHAAIAKAACEAADAMGAKAIVALTLTGSITRLMARWRPRTPIIAISPRRDVIQRLALVSGVFGLQNPLFYNTDVLLQNLPELLKELGLVKSGETIVITAGIPINQVRPTNMIKINRIP
jgi:pyruvate kinase